MIRPLQGGLRKAERRARVCAPALRSRLLMSGPRAGLVGAVGPHTRSGGLGRRASVAAAGLFVIVDLVTANMMKVLEGGWVPLARCCFFLPSTWRQGVVALAKKSRARQDGAQGIHRKSSRVTLGCDSPAGRSSPCIVTRCRQRNSSAFDRTG
jgi:hypothetical protein